MTFLQAVAKDILAKHGVSGLSDVAVVFPNKRASLFLNQALYEQAGQPLWSPAYITISDLFRQHSALTVPDQILLIFRLYNIYVKMTGSDETLDHFFSWGQLMLSDFDDLDKNLAEADKLFINLEAWQGMKDFSFLSDVQRKSLEEFFGKVMDHTELQQRYNTIWKHLGEIYKVFRKSLLDDGLAYEGMLYRDVAERKPSDFRYKHYIFVGFNLLQKVEQRLFLHLKDLGMAEFYWDYDKNILEPQQEAGRYIRQYLTRFPNELSEDRVSPGIDVDEVYNQLSKPKDITYLSAPTEDIQARYVTAWLQQRLATVHAENEHTELQRIAVVLGDEHLLQNVVHCLPKEATKVNITTGYPLSASPASTFVAALLGLQLNGLTNDRKHYKLRFVNQVLRHPYAKYLSEDCAPLCQELNEHKRVYLSRESLVAGRNEGIGVLFKQLPLTDGTLPLLPWIAEILRKVGIGSRDVKDPLMHESIFRMYTLINRLDEIMVVSTQGGSGIIDGKQVVSTVVLQRLIGQLIDATSIPFHGDPAIGVQIMGVLETRNLDFDHVLFLSCNEGNMPKGVNDASFIPHSLRKGYEMTTVENKVAVYAYYYYSLLQRASDVTLSYNNATDDGHQGEMSRFMLQFMVDNGDRCVIHRRTLLSGQEVSPVNRRPIKKVGVVKRRLDEIQSFSPTSLGYYLRCNLQFYYNTLCHLRQRDDNDVDELDNATFGDIFHRTAELIYLHLSGDNYEHTVTAGDIEQLMNNQSLINQFLDQAFREKYFKVDDPTFHPTYNGLQLLNRNVLRLYAMRLLELDKEHAPFDILALEEKYYDKLTLTVNGQQHDVVLGGQLDRLDRVVENGKPLIRVIDYKTGKPLTASAPSMDEIFDPQYVDSKHTTYYLQAFLYASIIRKNRTAMSKVNPHGDPVAPALLFIREAKGDDYDPILQIKIDERKRERVDDIGTVFDAYRDNLTDLLKDIFDTSKDFVPTDDSQRCENCVYRNICGL